MHTNIPGHIIQADAYRLAKELELLAQKAGKSRRLTIGKALREAAETVRASANAMIAPDAA